GGDCADVGQCAGVQIDDVFAHGRRHHQVVVAAQAADGHRLDSKKVDRSGRIDGHRAGVRRDGGVVDHVRAGGAVDDQGVAGRRVVAVDVDGSDHGTQTDRRDAEPVVPEAAQEGNVRVVTKADRCPIVDPDAVQAEVLQRDVVVAVGAVHDEGVGPAHGAE